MLVNGRPVSDEGWHRKKARQLFKLLLTRGQHSSTKEELIELLWPDSDPDTGSTNLRSTIHALRRALDAPDAQLGAVTVIADRESVRLQDQAIWVDAEEFEQMLESARVAADPLWLLQGADALYVGHYLPEDVYEDWAAERRERLKHAWATLRFQLAQQWESRGDLESAAASLRRLLQDDPCDERGARELMRLLSKQGRRSEAVRVYQTLVRALRNDLDVEPSNLTTVLFETELAHATGDESETQRHARPSHNLPGQPGAFIGRDQEMANATSLLSREDVRLLTLVGPGGCGKTRLALQLGLQLVKHFTRGAWFVDLSTIRNPDQIVFAIGRALGINQPAFGRSYFDCLLEEIGEDDMLLILDNFEQVIDGAPGISQLLASCPRLKVVATSRAPLHLRWEHQLEVNPLAEGPAVELFAHRAQAVKPDWWLTPANASSVAQLCRRLDNLPLAIELAAARIKLFTPGAMLARLDATPDMLTGGVRDMPDRHQGLDLAVGWSYALLSNAEQATFRRLSVFSGGCSLEAAVAVCADSSIGGARLLNKLHALVDKSLLRAQLQGDDEARFVMLQTIRDFAQAELANTGELDEQQHRLADWCVRLIERAEQELSGPAQSTWLDQLEREHDNFKVALRWCFEHGEVEHGIRLAAALGPFWEMRGFIQEAHVWLQQAICRRHAVSAALRTKLCCAAGHVAFLRGDDRAARTLLEESVTLSGTAASPHLAMQAMINLARIDLSENDESRAAFLLREAGQIAAEVGADASLAACLQLLGEVSFQGRQLTEARRLLRRSLQLRRAEGNNWATAQVLSDLGRVLHAEGDELAARKLVAEALRIWRDLADEWGIAYALEDFAIVLGTTDAKIAARLLAVASQARQRVGIRRLPKRESDLQATQRACVSVLGESAFNTAWSAGSETGLLMVVDEVLTSIAE